MNSAATSLEHDEVVGGVVRLRHHQPTTPAELECFDPANVTVSGGALNLSLIRQPHSCGGRVRPYSGGMVNTDGKFQFTYGLLQARIWLPGRGGQISNWPAFWTDGQNWPRDGEIDVLEGLGGKACWHFINRAAVRGNCVAGTFYDGWHTFGADWEPPVDHLLLRRPCRGADQVGVTHAPMYLILSLAATLSTVVRSGRRRSRFSYVTLWSTDASASGARPGS